MGFLLGYVIAYLIGGLTFLPLIVFTVIYNQSKEPESVKDRNEADLQKSIKNSLKNGHPVGFISLKAGEIEDKENMGKKTAFEGWLTITKEFYKFTQINPEDFKANVSNAEIDSKSVDPTAGNNGSSLFGKMLKRDTQTNSQNAEDDASNADETDVGATKLRQLRKKNRFYAVIKHGNLFLYSDETQKNLKHAIALENYFVTVWPRGLRDGQLFTKRTAVCLVKKDDFKNDDELKGFLEILSASNSVFLPKSTFYLYGDTTFEKEDWYFALIKATSTVPDASTFGRPTSPNLFDTAIMAKTLHYSTADMLELIETINSTEHQLNTKWLNALIGRLFLATYKTDSFKTAFANKIEEKLKKIKTPGFLDQLQIKRTDVGHAAPTFTNPKLKSLSPDGDLEILVDMQYQGRAMIEVATKLLLNIGVGFRQREFDIVVKIVVEKLNGQLLLKIKPQPSNRIWYTFTKMPELGINIEPLFSSRNLSYGIVTSVLQSKLKDAVRAGAVYPFFDDIVFYSTDGEIFRGGIFDKSVRDFDIDVKESFYESPTMNRSVSIHSRDVDSLDTDSIKLSATLPKAKKSSSQLSLHLNANIKNEEVETAQVIDSFEGDNLLDDDTSRPSDQIKDSVIKSYSKIKQWYKKKPLINNSDSSPAINSIASKNIAKDYNPPEMISNRRKKDSKSEIKSEAQYSTFPASSSSSFQMTASTINQRASGEAFINVERKRNGSKSSQTKYGSISSLEGLNFNHHSTLIPTSPKSPTVAEVDEIEKADVVQPLLSTRNALDFNKTSVLSPAAVLNVNHKMTLEQSFTHSIAASAGMNNEALDKIEHEVDLDNSKVLGNGIRRSVIYDQELDKTRSLKRKPPPFASHDVKNTNTAETNWVVSSPQSESSDTIE